MTVRNTVKVVHESDPDDYMIIAADDYDPARHVLWSERPKSAAAESPSVEAPASLPPVHPCRSEPEPVSASPTARAQVMAQLRLGDLGPEIGACCDIEVLRALLLIDNRNTVHRMVHRKLRQLEVGNASSHGQNQEGQMDSR